MYSDPGKFSVKDFVKSVCFVLFFFFQKKVSFRRKIRKV